MPEGNLVEARITGSIIGAFYAVHNELGFGLLEHVYMMALERELLSRGHEVGREVWIPVFYKGEELIRQRLDMIVDRKVIVEGKAAMKLPPEAERQVFDYVRATRREVGLLLHFGPKPRFRRIFWRSGSSVPSVRSEWGSAFWIRADSPEL